jgi:hypothetical protein
MDLIPIEMGSTLDVGSCSNFENETNIKRSKESVTFLKINLL